MPTTSVKETILVTAALPYINNVPHMGHIVGSHLPADIFYRYCKVKGHDVAFIGGSDEHGTPSVIAAHELGVPIRQLTDRLHDIHRRVYEKLNISYTNYSRTSKQIHHEVTKDFFKEIDAKGTYIHEEEMNMYYCEHDSLFLPDRFVIGTCPKCGYTSAYADQCEKCSSVISPGELFDARCRTCNNPPVLKSSPHLFLDLEKLSSKINAWVEEKKDVWNHHVYTTAKKWINEGLRMRSITRDLAWGVSVPNTKFEKKVFYVWFDAPIGYITFTKELGDSYYEKYWKNSNSKIYHFLGKDNIPFHTIFWPGMLIAHGGYTMPYNVVGFHYLNYEGQKFSKSKGIGVFCYNLLDSTINIDTLRAYLTSVIPESKDSPFQWEEYRMHVNSEVIGKVGNFFNRTLSLVWNNFGGSFDLDEEHLADCDELDKHMIDSIRTTPGEIGDLLFQTQFRASYQRMLDYAREGNVYLDRKAPWSLVKNGDLESARRVLYIALNLARSLAIVFWPIMPTGMQEIWNHQLGFQGSLDTPGIWDEALRFGIPKGHKINAPKPTYERIETERLEELRSELTKGYNLKDLVNE